MKVLLLSKYSRTGASSRLRSFQYLPFLHAVGVEVTVSTLFDDAYLSGLYHNGRRSFLSIACLYLRRLKHLLKLSRYDLIWVEKEIFPYFPPFVERLLSFFGKPYVVDYDDAIFHNYDLSANFLVRSLMSKKIDSVMANASYVIVGNKYLASRANEAGAKKIAIIPTVVDHLRYEMHESRAEKPMVIGWIGSPTTQNYVLEIKEALIAVCGTYGATLRLIGATPDMASQFDGIQIEILCWTEETETTLIREMDIGIMPLRDGPWEKGKCGYKLIQYMACGVPVVASPVGVNIDIVEDAGSGLLAGSIKEWEAMLTCLLVSRQRRFEMGRSGRAAVEGKYSLQAQKANLIRVLKSSVE